MAALAPRRAAGTRTEAAPQGLIRPAIATRRRLCLDHDLRRGTAGGAPELIAHLGRDVAVDLRMHPVWLGGDDRQAGIRRLANRHLPRRLAEERHARSLCLVPRATMAATGPA